MNNKSAKTSHKSPNAAVASSKSTFFVPSPVGLNLPTLVLRAAWESADILTVMKHLSSLDNCNLLYASEKRGSGTLLHAAAANGWTDVINVLVDIKKVDVDVVGGDNWTPLHFACRAGRLEAVRVLLRKGADPGAKGATGCSPFGIAAFNGHADVLKAMLTSSKGSFVARRSMLSEEFTFDGHRRTTVEWAAAKGQMDVLTALIVAHSEACSESDGHHPGSGDLRDVFWKGRELATQYGQFEIVHLLDHADTHAAVITLKAQLGLLPKEYFSPSAPPVDATSHDAVDHSSKSLDADMKKWDPFKPHGRIQQGRVQETSPTSTISAPSVIPVSTQSSNLTRGRQPGPPIPPKPKSLSAMKTCDTNIGGSDVPPTGYPLGMENLEETFFNLTLELSKVQEELQTYKFLYEESTSSNEERKLIEEKRQLLEQKNVKLIELMVEMKINAEKVDLLTKELKERENEVKVLQAELTQYKKQIECPLCLSEDCTHAFLPCGHLACEKCANLHFSNYWAEIQQHGGINASSAFGGPGNAQCPQCRKEIQMVPIKIYFK